MKELSPTVETQHGMRAEGYDLNHANKNIALKIL